MRKFWKFIGLLWCSLPNLKKRMKQKNCPTLTIEYLQRRMSKENPPYLMSCDDNEELLAIVAHPGHKINCQFEYVAILKGLTFHVFNERQDVRNFWRKIKYFGLNHFFIETNADKHCDFYGVDECIYQYSFWNKKQLPKKIKPILLKSNGNIVRGYWRKNDYKIEIYNPNPNSWKVYNPFPRGSGKIGNWIYRKVDQALDL